MDQLRAAQAALRKRATDVRLVVVPGLADDLRAIADALGELERRVGCVAAWSCAYLHRVKPGGIHPAEVESIAAMSDHARARLALAGLLSRAGEGEG